MSIIEPISPWEDVRQIGDCTLYLGDCLRVIPFLSGVDAVVTDPPYGIDYESGHATDALWSAGRKIEGDKTTAARDAVISLAGDVPQLHFGSWRAERPAKTRQVLIWDKKGALGMGALDIPWKPDHEEIYVLGKGFTGSRDCGSVIPCPPVQSMAKNGRQHPNEKPVQLMAALLRKVPGRVLDPFMGSGSTLVAAAQYGRSAIGIEVRREFFEIACRRVAAAYRQPDIFSAK